MLSFDRGSSRLLDWKDTRPHKLRLAMTLAVIGSRIPEEMKHQPFQLWLKPNSSTLLARFHVEVQSGLSKYTLSNDLYIQMRNKGLCTELIIAI